MYAVLAQDLNPSAINISYESWQLSVNAILVAMSILGAAANVIIVIALSKERSLSTNHIFLLSTCLGNIMLPLSDVFTGILNQTFGGFSLNPMGCIIQSSFMLGATNISLLSIMLMILDRYLVIFFKKHLSYWEIAFLLTQVWGMPFVSAAIAFGTNSQGFLYGLQSSGLYCIIAAWASHLINRIKIGMFVLLLLKAIASYCFVFGKIYLLHRKRNRIGKAESTGDPVISKKERRLLIECSSLALSYFVFMGPFWVKMAYEVSTRTPVSPSFDTLVLAMVICGPLSSAIIVFIFDSSVKSTIRQMIGFSPSPATKMFQAAGKDKKSQSQQILVLKSISSNQICTEHAS